MVSSAQMMILQKESRSKVRDGAEWKYDPHQFHMRCMILTESQNC